MTMAWMRKKKKAMAMTWKRSKRGVCGAWCVCALLCCVAPGSTEAEGGGSERQKSTLHTRKHKNLRPLDVLNTRSKYQAGFYAFTCQWASRVAQTQGGFSSGLRLSNDATRKVHVC